MRKSILSFSTYLENNYASLQNEISKSYTLDMDIFHDCIIDLYFDLSTGLQFKKSSVISYILIRYRQYRNKEITKKFMEKNKEDSTLEFIDNKVGSEISYHTPNNIKDKAKYILSKEDFILLDLYYYQKKPKRMISVFMDMKANEIDKSLESITQKLSKTISYESY